MLTFPFQTGCNLGPDGVFLPCCRCCGVIMPSVQAHYMHIIRCHPDSLEIKNYQVSFLSKFCLSKLFEYHALIFVAGLRASLWLEMEMSA